MEKEKIAMFVLVLIIAVVISVFLIVKYQDEFFKETPSVKVGVIEVGDCADVHYVLRYASNNTVYENHSTGPPLRVFVSFNRSARIPEGYENYSANMIEGFLEGLVGLREGENATIGPIPPEKAYGLRPEEGDVINISDEQFPQPLIIEFSKIIENVSVDTLPKQVQSMVSANVTTVYLLKDISHHVGEKLTLYPAWENDTVITKINETKMWYETRPSPEEMTNFTWRESSIFGGEIRYWENSSDAVINETSNKIVVTHNPVIGQKMNFSSGYSTTEYTVVNLSKYKINCSYVDSDGNITYREFDRVINITFNESQNVTYPYPEELMVQLLDVLRQYAPDSVPYSLSPLAGESLIFDVTVLKVYKTSSS